MFTAAECKEKARLKMAISESDIQNRGKDIKAADAWLFLASKLDNSPAIEWKE